MTIKAVKEAHLLISGDTPSRQITGLRVVVVAAHRMWRPTLQPLLQHKEANIRLQYPLWPSEGSRTRSQVGGSPIHCHEWLQLCLELIFRGVLMKWPSVARATHEIWLATTKYDGPYAQSAAFYTLFSTTIMSTLLYFDKVSVSRPNWSRQNWICVVFACAKHVLYSLMYSMCADTHTAGTSCQPTIRQGATLIKNYIIMMTPSALQ